MAAAVTQNYILYCNSFGSFRFCLNITLLVVLHSNNAPGLSITVDSDYLCYFGAVNNYAVPLVSFVV